MDSSEPHIVLLGDSIFDNGRYTSGGPDVISQVCQLLPKGWRGSLLAVDGATTEDIPSQLRRIPSDATHLVLSVGGNDALMNADILRSPADSTSQALEALARVSQNFEIRYRRAIEGCRQIYLPLTICTIYNGCFPEASFQQLVSTALMVFNDVILRIGFEFGLSIIDLRFVCSLADDYANPIEPSSIGGAKIARAIVNLVSSRVNENSGARVVVA
jgi:hypothetical protein